MARFGPCCRRFDVFTIPMRVGIARTFFDILCVFMLSPCFLMFLFLLGCCLSLATNATWQGRTRAKTINSIGAS